ncbi:hypothetical protein GOODEAATRI_001309 [Goodea atripinnis]|uniref:Uncharacterized protein n=1 Tax=Goodea atripinnis TaxID=208336 RepID=A0ABV0N703_9TELE
MAFLTTAVYNLVELYLRSFCPPSPSFSLPTIAQSTDVGGAVEVRSSKEASGTTDHLQFTLFALHGIPGHWVSRLKRSDHQVLWDHRLHCRRDHPSSLPKVLASAPSWDWASMGHIHSLLHRWPSLPLVTALELLDSKFADTEVRSVAVSWIEKSGDDELTDYLPQLVQAIKFECHLNNALVMFLLSRAQGNINIAHYLYWLLKDAVQDSTWGRRYELVLGALLCLGGSKLRAELEKQTHLATLLGTVAERVRQAGGSTRQVALQEGLENIQNLFQRNSCRLPLNPSLVAKELNVKVGEDLRQDMLALQMIRIMDRIWLQEGLDLRIVNFKCISTGKDKAVLLGNSFSDKVGLSPLFFGQLDRAPFVLTSDMAYVINGGERPTSRFQLFVDLCCQAYNLIRKNSGLLIESSLGSIATKFNFFIHNLAQLRFSGLPANDEPILSFSPKTYTMKQDGRIVHASIFSFQKRYNPDKHYVSPPILFDVIFVKLHIRTVLKQLCLSVLSGQTYVVRIMREGQNEAQFVFRTFDEFQELHNKLTIVFPLWKLPG